MNQGELSATALESLSDDELFERLGQCIAGKDGVLLSTSDPDQLRENGKNWFRRNQEALRKTICESASIQKAIHATEPVDNIHIIVSIISLYEHVYSVLHASLVATLVLRKGLSKFCNA